MKLTCPQSLLNAKLSLLSRIVPNNPSHPVLANVLLTAEPDRLGLSVFDLSIGMQVWIPAVVDKPGTLTLPARLFSEIVSKLPNKDVVITTDDVAVSLACGSGKYQMQGISADEFPELPDLAKIDPIQIDAGILSEGIQSTLFAASSDESKQILTGLHFGTYEGGKNEGGLEICGTNGHQLAIASFPDLILDTINATIPARALRELEKMLTRSSATVSVRSDRSQVVFDMASEHGTERLTCRLLDGQYPAYNQLVPKDFNRKIAIDRQELMSSVDRIAVLAARKNNIIRLRFDADAQCLFLSAEAPEFGSGQESIPASITGESIEIACNTKYLTEALKAAQSNECLIQVKGETTPFVLSPVSGKKATYLIMPIQIR
jgi:DNA polymerase III subunit beta